MIILIMHNNFLDKPVESPNYKYIIFEFGEKHFLGSFSKDITTKYIYEYVKREILEQNLISKNEDIKITCFDGKDLVESFQTINEAFEITLSNNYYIFYSGLTKEQQEIILKLKISKIEIQTKNKTEYNEKYEKMANDIYEKYENLYQIFCKNYCGNTFALQFNPEMTVEDLKTCIAASVGIEPDDQRIIFRGIQLDDGYKLSKYNISRESTIHVIARLRGGMFITITSGNIDYQNIQNCKVDFNFDT
jgi:hypothetical protein